MEQNKMSDNQFDALWQRAEAEGYAIHFTLQRQ